MENRRSEREIRQVPGRHPRIVRDDAVAGLPGIVREAIQKVSQRARQDADERGNSGRVFGQRIAVRIHQARGEIIRIRARSSKMKFAAAPSPTHLRWR